MPTTQFIKHEKVIIKHIIDELIDQKQSIYNCLLITY